MTERMCLHMHACVHVLQFQVYDKSPCSSVPTFCIQSLYSYAQMFTLSRFQHLTLPIP